MTSRRLRAVLALAAAVLLLGGATGCSGDDSTETEAGETIDAVTPLTALGLGPIRAGMTLRAAETASSLDLPPHEQDFEIYPERRCFNASVEGQPDLGMIVLAPGDDVADPLDGVIGSIYLQPLWAPGSRATERTTDAGITLGATEAEVEAAHPGAIEEEPHHYVPEGAYLYVFPPDHPGFGIRYVLDETRTVVGIDVGEERAIRLVENCS